MKMTVRLSGLYQLMQQIQASKKILVKTNPLFLQTSSAASALQLDQHIAGANGSIYEQNCIATYLGREAAATLRSTSASAPLGAGTVPEKLVVAVGPLSPATAAS